MRRIVRDLRRYYYSFVLILFNLIPAVILPSIIAYYHLLTNSEAIILGALILVLLTCAEILYRINSQSTESFDKIMREIDILAERRRERPEGNRIEKDDEMKTILYELQKAVTFQASREQSRLREQQEILYINRDLRDITNELKETIASLADIEQTISTVSSSGENKIHLVEGEHKSVAEGVSNKVQASPPIGRLEGNHSKEVSIPDKLLIYQQVSNEYIHIISTPLASIETAIANVKERLAELSRGDDNRSLNVINILLSALENASISLESIKSILRHGAGFLLLDAERASVETIIRKAIRIASASAHGQPIISIGLEKLPEVKYYQANLLIAMVQVLENAYEALDFKGKITIEVEYNTSTGKIEILVSNDCASINPEDQHKIFEQGYSTKGPGRGSGLTIARRCLEAVNGQIELVSNENNEVTFKISFQPEEIY